VCDSSASAVLVHAEAEQRIEPIMKAIILSAGQGSRLLPLTEARPKCLVEVNGQSVLARQVNALATCGITEIVVVVGFFARLVEEEIARLQRPGLVIRSLHNPFFKVADNLASCWLVREEMKQDFLLLNGDTLFEPAICRRLLAQAALPVTLTIDHKSGYDADDMKVALDGDRVIAVNKTMPMAQVDGESIGLSLWRGDGPALFVAALEYAMQHQESVGWWYLRVVEQIARETGSVGTVSIQGLRWSELDFLPDLDRAESLFAQDELTIQQVA
jgi:L-glutamine-phosphate cytidylyltransferase